MTNGEPQGSPDVSFGGIMQKNKRIYSVKLTWQDIHILFESDIQKVLNLHGFKFKPSEPKPGIADILGGKLGGGNQTKLVKIQQDNHRACLLEIVDLLMKQGMTIPHAATWVGYAYQTIHLWRLMRNAGE